MQNKCDFMKYLLILIGLLIASVAQANHHSSESLTVSIVYGFAFIFVAAVLMGLGFALGYFCRRARSLMLVPVGAMALSAIGFLIWV